jgi:FkbH-like protein
MITMSWLPCPDDFRRELKSAVAIEQSSERLERLTALAQQRLGFVETIQVDKALGEIVKGAVSGFTRIRLAILASATVDHLLPAIRVAGLRRRLLIDVYAGPFGQYRQQLLDPASELYRFNPDLILLSLSWRDFGGAVPLTATADEVQRTVTLAVEDLRALWRKGRQSLNAVAIQQSFLDVTDPLFGNHEWLVPASPARLIARLNDSLAEAAAQDGILLLDVARASARDGISAWFDVARWLQAKMEIAPQATPLYGDLVARLIAAQRGLSKKCLVLDLDNTLWGGVVGDVGVEGLVLGEGSAAGEAYLALQRYAKSLTERGIILAVCSKNEAAIAEEAFRNHPEMVLKLSDVAAFLANWTDKAENLKAIAARLNIGLDSLVLVDDNPVERARVRQSLPMVAVPELPADPAQYVRCIADAGYFETVAFTEDDRQRVEQYAANNARDALRESLLSVDDFLRGLDMSLVFGPISALDLPRVTQLINKTNQFNTTTRRITSDDMAALARSPANIALQFRLIDRFGDNGLVSVMLLCPHQSDAEVLEIVNWVMSCRVFGRQLEDEAMNIAVETARARGIRTISADFIASSRNGVIRDLYSNLAFSPAPGAAPAGTTRWQLKLSEYVFRPTFIQRRVTS